MASPVRTCEMRRVLEAIRRCGIHRELEAVLNPTRTGRPRQLKVDVFLAGVMLTVMKQGSLTLSNVHDTLTKALPRSAQIALGTSYRQRPGEVSRPLSIRQVRYVLERIELRLAYSERRAPELSDADRDDRAAALDHIVNKVVETSLPQGLPRPRAFALDATALESWGRGKRRAKSAADLGPVEEADVDQHAETDEKPTVDDEIIAASHLGDAVTEGTSVDPDAKWGYRTRTYDNKTKSCFGFNLFSMVAVPPVDAEKGAIPTLTYGIRIRPANRDEVEPGLSLVDALNTKEAPVEELIPDRAWSYKQAKRWADEVRARGVETVFDLHPNDRGNRDYKAMPFVDGWGHCPAMARVNPATGRDRIDVPRPVKFVVGEPKKNATPQEVAANAKLKAAAEKFKGDIVERRQWAFDLVANASESARDQGKQRFTCPARAGKVACPHVEFSMHLPDGTPRVENPPDLKTAPVCCTQRTFTIPGTVTPKIRQRLYWGGEEWIKSYNRRTYVEGFFGNMKNPSTENVRRGWCRVVGIVKTGLLAACAVAATNIRMLRAWSAKHAPAGFTDPLCTIDPPDHGFEELTESEWLTLADRLISGDAGPPTAAAA